MKKFFLLGLTAALALTFASCNTAEKYEQNRLAGDKWLADKTASARINVTGTWHTDDWGGAILRQSGRQVTGTIGQFTAKGVVSGSKLYLLLSENDWIYYTAILDQPSSGQLVGFYSYTVPFSLADQRTMVMRKL